MERAHDPGSDGPGNGEEHLTEWSCRQRSLVDRLISRRLAVAAMALIGGAVATRPARAFSIEPAPAILDPLPERDGVVAWRTLAGTVPTPAGLAFPPDVEALAGREIVLDGFMMAMDGRIPQRRFLLTALPAHCPYCMPGGMPAIVEVVAGEGIPLRDRQLMTLRGRFDLVRGSDGMSPFYSLDQARLA